MKRFLAAAVCVSLFITIASIVLAGAGGGKAATAGVILAGAEYVPGEVLVKFKAGASRAGRGRLMKSISASDGDTPPGVPFQVLKLEGDTVEKALGELRSSGLVQYAEPNYVRRAYYTPDDPAFGGFTDPVDNQYKQQWNLNDPSANHADINVATAWDTTKGDPSVVVAIIDTGVAYETYGGFVQAPDLAPASPTGFAPTFTQGADFINNDSHANDDEGHGTHVCGTIAQSTNNAVGCSGIAPKCSIMPIKVLDNEGAGDDASVSAGINYAADHGANVINMSLGGPAPSDALKEAVDYAASKDVVICAATGNDGEAAVSYPAAYDACIAVGATNARKQRAAYSNYGPEVDVVAPGGDQFGSIYQQTFKTTVTGMPILTEFAIPLNWAGTSMATPHVAGIAALVKSAHMNWNASDVAGAVVSTCRDLGSGGWDEQYGNGLVDATAALSATQQAKPEVTGISPNHGNAGSTTSGVIVSGSNLSAPLKVILEREGENTIAANNIKSSGSSDLTCDFDLRDAVPGLWNVRVENSGFKSYLLEGGFMVDTSTTNTWYLAEGSTAYGFEEFILIQNPNKVEAKTSVTLMTPTGPISPFNVTVAADSRVTINVNGILPNTDVSAMIESDQGVICERSMYWDNRVEGTDAIGIETPSYTWYFAEGSTNYGYSTYVLIQNPAAYDSLVEITYMTKSGPKVKDPFVVEAGSRVTVDVARDLPNEDMSFKIIADERVIAERSVYWDGFRGGHDSIGVNGPAQEWYLAEGATSYGYDEYVLIQNPGTTAANVDLTYMTPDGPVPQPTLRVDPGTRTTVHVNEALPGKDVSVKAKSDKGIVVERAMYWNNGTGKGGHGSIAIPQPRTQCFLAEGTTDWGFDEWVLVQNPNNTPANIGVEYMTSKGLMTRNGFTLNPGTRASIHVNGDLPKIDTSTRVYSNLPIIAERSMYWSAKGGGHVSQGLMR